MPAIHPHEMVAGCFVFLWVAEVPQFHWTPSIGDPTLVGWLTAALYLAAAVGCWRVARHLGFGEAWPSTERRVWRFVAVLFLALGLNKQLDLQTALTQAVRIIAYSEGWFEQRRVVQTAFIAVVALICVAIAAALAMWARKAPTPVWFALAGVTMVLAYVLIRAASFHHVLGGAVLHLTWIWILEVSGIGVVLLGCGWRRTELAQAESYSFSPAAKERS